MRKNYALLKSVLFLFCLFAFGEVNAQIKAEDLEIQVKKEVQWVKEVVKITPQQEGLLTSLLSDKCTALSRPLSQSRRLLVSSTYRRNFEIILDQAQLGLLNQNKELFKKLDLASKQIDSNEE